MPKTRQAKIEMVQMLTDKLSASSSVVFADYQGLTMSQLSDLRNQLREMDAEFLVTKNNLLSIALKNNNLPELSAEAQSGPIATLFAHGDEIMPIKALVKALKEAGKGKIKAGIIDENSMDSFSVIRLSNLPSKLELQAKVVGSLSAPLYGIVNVLQGNLRNLVYAIDQIKIKKGGEAQA